MSITNQLDVEKRNSKVFAVIAVLVTIAMPFLTWFLGGDSVPNGSALGFILDTTYWLFLVAFIAAVGICGWVIKKVLSLSELTEVKKGPYIFAMCAMFAVCMWFGLTRYNAGNDINVSARYKAWKAK